jgi:hypothetical protein
MRSPVRFPTGAGQRLRHGENSLKRSGQAPKATLRAPRSDSLLPAVQHLYRSPRIDGYMKFASLHFGGNLFNSDKMLFILFISIFE